MRNAELDEARRSLCDLEGLPDEAKCLLVAAACGGPTHPTPEGPRCLWEVAWGRWEAGWKKEQVQSLDTEWASELCRWGVGVGVGVEVGLDPGGGGALRTLVCPQLRSAPLAGCAKGRRGSRCPRNLGSSRSTLGLRV